MRTHIKLGDIDASSLSNETLNWISRLSLEIDKVSGKRVRSSDPDVLVSLRDTVGKLKDPKVNALYELFKRELLRSIDSGHYDLRHQTPAMGLGGEKDTAQVAADSPSAL